MCTVILNVPADADAPVHMLAVRDEDPKRPWMPLGAWWPQHPDVVGVRDVRAGGAWLAADASRRRVAVLLNRHSPALAEGVTPITRGTLPLQAVEGEPIAPTAAVQGFNLVSVAPSAVEHGGVRVISWDGVTRTETAVQPGVHMIAHDDLDDVRTARIMAWRTAFAAASDGARPDALQDAWLSVLAHSGELDPNDDRAIIRDNTPLGYPTQSLLVCTATVDASGADVRYAQFDEPGRWNPLHLVPPVS